MSGLVIFPLVQGAAFRSPATTTTPASLSAIVPPPPPPPPVVDPTTIRSEGSPTIIIYNHYPPQPPPHPPQRHDYDRGGGCNWFGNGYGGGYGGYGGYVYGRPYCPVLPPPPPSIVAYPRPISYGCPSYSTIGGFCPAPF